MEVTKRYDVIILGGGLAGLTLAFQLKKSRSNISILVIEKRNGNAPVAIHKVGESTSELGSSYLREVLNLKKYLTECQLPKFGFRFFFSPEHSDDISRRVEVGSRISIPYPTHQIDRGLFENYLTGKLSEEEVDIHLGAKVLDVKLLKGAHQVLVEKGNKQYVAEGTWVVDSTGRGAVLKRMLGLALESDHTINSAWFRIEHKIDIDDWSDNVAWRNLVDKGRRRLATNHLMGEGYWVWIIPLVSGCTSIGIVADPRFHPFDKFNTYDKAMQWLTQFEPLAARMISFYKDGVMDFKLMKNFAYNTMQFYSSDRWAVTGEAGAFLDPFYSPGTDFIALGNTWITDLVCRDLLGEDIKMRTMIFDLTHRELINGWIQLYRDMYSVFGKTQVMLMKIIWDWATYWAIPNVMFMNGGYTNISILKQFSSVSDGIGRKFSKLNDQMQKLFQAWSAREIGQFEDRCLNVFDLKCLHQFQMELNLTHKPEDLINKIRSNLQILEQIAGEIFRMASARINGTPEDMRVDPYAMHLNDGRDDLMKKALDENAHGVTEWIKSDIARFWLSTSKAEYHEFAQ
jgi:flavin-dependent dehydrogenase